MSVGSTEVVSPPWELPTPQAVLKVTMADGAQTYVRRHGNPLGQRILLSHGCGLATDSYLPFWSLLLQRFDLFLYDLRSHGWNPPGDLRNQNIPTFVRDCETVLRAIGSNFEERPVLGIFHSISALVALLHEEQWKGFAGLVLFDPPIQPPGGNPEDLVEIGEEMSSAARGRREEFRTRREYVSLVKRSIIYRRLLPGLPDLIAKTTLRPHKDQGGFRLCCPREHEAQVYEYLFGWAMRVDLQKVSCPLKVLGADPTEPYSFMPTANLSNLIDINYDFLPNTSHFLQLEKPDNCVEAAVEFLESLSLI